MTHRSTNQGRRGERGPGRRLQFLGRRLDLSVEQMAELGERLGRHRAKGRELFLTHRAERLDIIRDVLDDEQSERFEAMLRRRGERGGRRHRHHGRGHGRGHGRPRPEAADGSEDDVRA